MFKRERVAFDGDEYYIIFDDMAEGVPIDKHEYIIYCPFCGAKLGDK